MKALKHGHVSARSGFTILDLAATVAVGTLMCAAALPLAAKAGSKNTRAVSRMHLNTLHVVHTMFAADHNDRQFSVIPDNFGLRPSCALYQAQFGCIDPLVLGEDSLGQSWGFYLGCAGNGTNGACGNISFYKPIEFTEPTEGAYRYANTPRINEYVSGRFYDPVFFAPDDPTLTDQTRKFIRAGADFELNDPDGASYIWGHTSYDMSPAAMFDPVVMGDGQQGNNPQWRNPSSTSTAGGYGYRSVDVTLAGGLISALVPAGEGAAPPGAVVVDCADKLLLPGSVNAHTHTSEHWARGLIKPLPLELWIHQLVRARVAGRGVCHSHQEGTLTPVHPPPLR
jgi:hypothetical protein